MSKEIKGKIAVVTGATRGIGRAIAERLLREGAKVALCGRRQETVAETVKGLGSQGDVFGAAADVSKFEEANRFIADAAKRFGGVDALINNAGAGTFRSVAELTPREWDQMISLNLSGVYYCCHSALPIFRERGGGDVINISSLAGKNPFAGGAAYNASKFGLNGFSEAMMLDHRYDGVRVSYIMPGSVDTAFGGSQTSSEAEWKIAPEDIAEIVVTLLRMPQRTNVSRVEIRPSRPPKKV
jgi:3-oxoacyl-[acyl-carrier protein] reductase